MMYFDKISSYITVCIFKTKFANFTIYFPVCENFVSFLPANIAASSPVGLKRAVSAEISSDVETGPSRLII